MADTHAIGRWISETLLVLAAGALLLSGCSGEDPGVEKVREVPRPPSAQTAVEPPVQVVTLDEQQATELGIETIRAVASKERFPLVIPGTVFPAPDHLALVSAPISGRVVRIYAHEGEAVRQGQALLELESLEFASLAADYLQAKADEAYAGQQVERLQLLVDKKISPRSTLEKAQADQLRADAAVRAAYARLKALGVADAQLDAWLRGEDGRPLLTIRAPIRGVMSEHLIDLGQAVTAYEKMLSLVNLDRVLIRGYVSPEDAALVQAGDPVVVTLKDFPGRALRAEVATINPALDEASKSVTVNIVAATQAGWPLPGQSVRLEVRVTPPQPVLTLPLSAVQYEGDRATVFVRTNPRTFEKRAITISRVNDDAVIVASGLAEEEEVVVTQVFSLKALGRYEQYAEE